MDTAYRVSDRDCLCYEIKTDNKLCCMTFLNAFFKRLKTIKVAWALCYLFSLLLECVSDLKRFWLLVCSISIQQLYSVSEMWGIFYLVQLWYVLQLLQWCHRYSINRRGFLIHKIHKGSLWYLIHSKNHDNESSRGCRGGGVLRQKQWHSAAEQDSLLRQGGS